MACVYPQSGCGSRVRCVCRLRDPASCAHISCFPMPLSGSGRGRDTEVPRLSSAFRLIFDSRYGVIGSLALIPLPSILPSRPSSQALLGRGFGSGSASRGLYGLSYLSRLAYANLPPPLGRSPPLSRRDRYGLALKGVTASYTPSFPA